MTPRSKILLTLCACAATGWGGYALGGLNSRNEAPSLSLRRASHSSVSAVLEPIPDEASILRRNVARCQTGELWAILADAAHPVGQGAGKAIIGELCDRQGIHALELCFDLAPSSREWFSGICMEKLAAKDPWSVYALFLQHRAGFSKNWALAAQQEFMRASCGVSAARTIEVAGLLSRDASRGESPSFAPDYAFRTVLDDPAVMSSDPMNLRRALVSEWALRAPAEALDWVIAKHPIGDYDYSEAMNELLTVCTETEKSTSPDRAAALERLAELPEQLRAKIGKEAGGENPGELDAALLDVAEVVGQREAYLSAALLATRGNAALDHSWSALPEDLRQSALDAALAKWSGEDETPVAVEARAHWKRMVETGWSKAAEK
jgi:hypothetical protein